MTDQTNSRHQAVIQAQAKLASETQRLQIGLTCGYPAEDIIKILGAGAIAQGELIDALAWYQLDRAVYFRDQLIKIRESIQAAK